jgi:hypothetical protein
MAYPKNAGEEGTAKSRYRVFSDKKGTLSFLDEVALFLSQVRIHGNVCRLILPN